jgi:predicted  nucleic acid-binding Zn-ribbon protein
MKEQSGHSIYLLKMETNGMVERIRSLLARFPEDEETVRRIVVTDASFNALCHEYRKVIELLDRFEAEATQLPAEVERLTHLRASLEEELLSRIDGHEPH